MNPHDCLRQHADASALVASVRDVIAEREGCDAPPAWCEQRGWTRFLDALDDDAVGRAERDGLGAVLERSRGAPGDLVGLAREVARCTTALRAAGGTTEARAVERRGASPRKQAQVAAFAALVERARVRPSRVVDLGSGHGHLTRHLARALGVPAEGWDHDPARVRVAAALGGREGPRFVAQDARAWVGRVEPGDLVVGLHACGALGEAAVRAAGDAGAALVFVGCCPQKRGGDRAPLVVPAGLDAGALVLGRAVLGLANAGDGDEGVEADRATRARSRVLRRALRALLRDAGLELAPGAEMHGVNRRRATGGFDALVERACAARGVAVPSTASRERALREAAVAQARASRWGLPRAMLARLVEAYVALDRAAYLAARGYDAEAVVAFSREVSPRNLAVVARPGG